MNPTDPRTASSPAGSERFDFDDQARDFDARAGLPGAAARAAAASLLAACRQPGDLILDVGAGTGSLGRHLPAGTGRYVGLDLSLPMLREFARAIPGPIDLVQADASRGWPVRSDAVRVVFLSRAAHLLDPDHLLAESERVARAEGAFLVLARVVRAPDSVRSEMRGAMRRELARRGLEGRGGGGWEKRTTHPIRSESCASWTREESPRLSLESWRRKPGLSGIDLDRTIKDEVLQAVEDWARERYGSLDRVSRSEERYELRWIELSHRERTA